MGSRQEKLDTDGRVGVEVLAEVFGKFVNEKGDLYLPSDEELGGGILNTVQPVVDVLVETLGENVSMEDALERFFGKDVEERGLSYEITQKSMYAEGPFSQGIVIRYGRDVDTRAAWTFVDTTLMRGTYRLAIGVVLTGEEKTVKFELLSGVDLEVEENYDL